METRREFTYLGFDEYKNWSSLKCYINIKITLVLISVFLNKKFKFYWTVPYKSLPPILRTFKFAKRLAASQIILGVCLCIVALWLVIWAPNISTRDNPYWSGIPVSFGTLLLWYHYPKRKFFLENVFQFLALIVWSYRFDIPLHIQKGASWNEKRTLHLFNEGKVLQ